MNIALPYTVHSAQVECVPTDVSVNDVTVVALVERLVIELAADDGGHGHMFRLPVSSKTDLAAHQAAFPVGAVVTVTLSAGAAQ